MRTKTDFYGGVRLWLTANDTYEWANKPGGLWPCSVVAGLPLYVELAPNGDLIDCQLGKCNSERDIPSLELDAIVADHLAFAVV